MHTAPDLRKVESGSIYGAQTHPVDSSRLYFHEVMPRSLRILNLIHFPQHLVLRKPMHQLLCLSTKLRVFFRRRSLRNVNLDVSVFYSYADTMSRLNVISFSTGLRRK